MMEQALEDALVAPLEATVEKLALLLVPVQSPASWIMASNVRQFAWLPAEMYGVHCWASDAGRVSQQVASSVHPDPPVLENPLLPPLVAVNDAPLVAMKLPIPVPLLPGGATAPPQAVVAIDWTEQVTDVNCPSMQERVGWQDAQLENADS
jgi:hypothetical protein